MGARASKMSRTLWCWRVTRSRLQKPPPPPQAPRGYVPVCVGVDGDESRRFMIHTTSFRDAELVELLRLSAAEYGYRNDGVLRIPYDARSFEERLIGRDGARRSLKVITP